METNARVSSNAAAAAAAAAKRCRVESKVMVQFRWSPPQWDRAMNSNESTPKELWRIHWSCSKSNETQYLDEMIAVDLFDFSDHLMCGIF